MQIDNLQRDRICLVAKDYYNLISGMYQNLHKRDKCGSYGAELRRKMRESSGVVFDMCGHKFVDMKGRIRP